MTKSMTLTEALLKLEEIRRQIGGNAKLVTRDIADDHYDAAYVIDIKLDKGDVLFVSDDDCED